MILIISLQFKSHYKFIIYGMRRQFNLDDYQIPTQQFRFQSNQQQSSKSRGINTDEFQMKSMRIQTVIRNSEKEHFTVQTSPYLIAKQYEQIRAKQSMEKRSPKRQNNNQQSGQQQQQYIQQQQQVQVSEEVIKRVTRFVKRVAPLMLKELQQNLPQYAKLGNQIEQSAFKRDSKLTHTLENLDYHTQEQRVLEVSDIAWNSTGIAVAAAYSRATHDGTCSHKSMISIWFLYKRNFKATKPETIQTPNCINTISFHPKKPSILACGSYVGQILLYDFSKKQEQLIAKSSIDDYFHRDVISQLSWWAFRPPGKTETEHNLLSLGTDGKILLWEISNYALAEQAASLKSKMMLQHPIKGFLMLRKKQGKIIPVSGLSMNQSKFDRNMFIIGSEGGSILRATLNPICHHYNTESKVILDLQQTVKFKPKVYPFLLNIPAKNLPDLKSHVQKYCGSLKIKQVDSVQKVLASKPQIRSLYPNPISFAYQPLAYPISSISHNRYGLFIANGCDGYSRIYIEGNRKSIESIEDGYQWGWIDSGSRMGGFIGQQYAVADFLTEQILWSVAVGEGTIWKQNGYQVAVVCERTKVKILQLGDKILGQDQNRKREINKKIEQLNLE